MSQRVREEASSPPKTKKFKNNEILSSFSSSKPCVVTARSSSTSSRMDVDTSRTLKRKFVRSTTDSEDESHDDGSDAFEEQTVTRSTVKRPMTRETYSSPEELQESRTDTSIVSASDKENEDEYIASPEDIEAAKRRKAEKEVFSSCTPIHYHSLEDHLRDEKKRSNRLARLLGAARIGLEEEQAKKVSPEKPNLSNITSPSIPQGNPNQGLGTIILSTAIDSPVTATSTATTVVHSIPSSISSVVPITSNPLLTNAVVEDKKPSLGFNLPTVTQPSNVVVNAGIVTFGQTTTNNPTTPAAPQFNFNQTVLPVAQSVQPPSTSQQMNSLQNIAGNLNFTAGSQVVNQGMVGGGGLFNLNAAPKKPQAVGSRRKAGRR
jgi:hypothetical protein